MRLKAWKKTNTSPTFPCQSCSIRPARYVCWVFFFFCSADKDEQKKADDQPWTPTAVIHVAAPLPQSFDAMPSYTHSADELEIIITPLNGSIPRGGVRGFRCSIHKTRRSENTGEGKAGIHRSWQGIAAVRITQYFVTERGKTLFYPLSDSNEIAADKWSQWHKTEEGVSTQQIL